MTPEELKKVIVDIFYKKRENANRIIPKNTLGNFYKKLKSKKEMKDIEILKEFGKELSEIINQDGDDISDGECIDQIVTYLKNKGLYIERI